MFITRFVHTKNGFTKISKNLKFKIARYIPDEENSHYHNIFFKNFSYFKFMNISNKHFKFF